MGVGVDKAGEQQAPGDIHGLVGLGFQIAAEAHDFFSVNEKIGPLHSGTVDHSAAFEQRSHKTTLQFGHFMVSV